MAGEDTNHPTSPGKQERSRRAAYERDRQRLLQNYQRRLAQAHPADQEALRQGYTEDWARIAQQHDAGRLPQRFLLYCTEWDPHKGGIVAVNRNLAEGLAEAGHEVFVRVGHPVPEGAGGERIHLIGPREYDPARDAQAQLAYDGEELPANVDTIIGHSRYSGPQALQVRDEHYPDTPFIPVVHMVTGALARVAKRPDLEAQFEGIERRMVANADMAALDATTSQDLIERRSALLNRDVLTEGYTPPQHMQIDDWEYCDPGDLADIDPSESADAESERPERDFACVWVDYQLAHQNAPIESTMVPVKRESTGWLRGWHISDIDPLLGEVDITNDHRVPVQLGGAPISNKMLASALLAPQPAVIGSYDLATTTPDEAVHEPVDEDHQELFEIGQTIDTIHVPVMPATAQPPPAEATVDDTLTVAEDVLAEVTDQVHAHIDTCAESDDLRPATCPMEGEDFDAGRYRPTDDVKWTIDKLPEIELQATTDPLEGAPITVETTTPGQATATWTYTRDDEEHTATVEVTPDGTVDHNTDGDITYHP